MPIAAVGLSTADFASGLADLPACLARFAAWGVDSAEISLSQFEVVVGARVRADRLRRLRDACRGAGLSVTVHGPISATFTDAAHLALQLDACRAVLDVAGEIGASIVVHHAGGAPLGVEAARLDALARERDALATIAPHAAERGVVLAVENIFGDAERWFAAPHELAAQIAAVDHPAVRATIDFSHAAINAGVRGFDVGRSLEALAPWAAHLHIHDSFGRPRSFTPYTTGDAVAYGLGDLHLPPGWGVIDWGAMARLPFDPRRPIVANLEMQARHSEEVGAAISLCRRMIERETRPEEAIVSLGPIR